MEDKNPMNRILYVIFLLTCFFQAVPRIDETNKQKKAVCIHTRPLNKKNRLLLAAFRNAFFSKFQ